METPSLLPVSQGQSVWGFRCSLEHSWDRLDQGWLRRRLDSRRLWKAFSTSQFSCRTS